MLQSFIDAGVNLDSQNINGYTALMMALEFDFHYSIIKLLIKSNCNLNLQCKFGWTALVYASIYSDLETVKLLIKKGTNIYIRTNANQSLYELSEDNKIKKYLNEFVMFQVWKIREQSKNYMKNAFSVYNIMSNVFLFFAT